MHVIFSQQMNKLNSEVICSIVQSFGSRECKNKSFSIKKRYGQQKINDKLGTMDSFMWISYPTSLRNIGGSTQVPGQCMK